MLESLKDFAALVAIVAFVTALTVWAGELPTLIN